MRVVLVGADFEENLGIGMIAAVARLRGHDVRVVPFNVPEEMVAVVRVALARDPHVIGLGIQFQHRAHEFLALARALRTAGFRGHLTCGGQFPTLAFAEVLGEGAVDSVVLHDGEEAFGELLDALAAGRPISGIAGLAIRDDAGAARRTAPRPLLDDLDSLPFPLRYRPHATHCGIPFIPIMASRGCWGACSYCSITSTHRDARASGGGRAYRARSAEDVAEEMATLADRVGGPCIFCFHDDNLLLPHPAHTLARLEAIRAELDLRRVGRIGIIGKCRPETLTPELAQRLRALGVIRLYVGIENASAAGAEHLGRGKQHLAIDAALEACRTAGIFACYNLLLFEPGATIDDVEVNVGFMRRHADHPVNFCRAEPYHGTPLQIAMASRGALFGSYLGYDYRIDDDRTELLFRVAAAAFRERNFRPDGVANRTMGLGYQAKVMEHFHDGDHAERARLARSAGELTRAITLDTAHFLDDAIALAHDADLGDRDAIERKAARLGLAIAAADAAWHRELDQVYAQLDEFGQRARRRFPPVVGRVARGVVAGAGLAIGTAGASCGGDTTVDPAPADAGRDAQRDVQVVDPAPQDAGRDVQVVDPVPPDAGVDAQPDGTVVDPPPPDAGLDALLDQWRDTSPRRAVRGDDLPLFDPPDVRMVARRDGETIVARVEGGPSAVSFRWEAEGAVDGDGREVRWTPDDAAAALRVAVRAKGGVAVVSVRAHDVVG